jgi:hypothetical protein
MPAEPDEVERRFRETFKVETAVPPQFNYAHLDFYGMGDFQGKPVPFLRFIRQSFKAEVYILSDKQFDLNNLEGPVGYPVKVLAHPANPHVRYVVIYSSETLDGFLNKPSNAVGEGPRGRQGQKGPAEDLARARF